MTLCKLKMTLCKLKMTLCKLKMTQKCSTSRNSWKLCKLRATRATATATVTTATTILMRALKSLKKIQTTKTTTKSMMTTSLTHYFSQHADSKSQVQTKKKSPIAAPSALMRPMPRATA